MLLLMGVDAFNLFLILAHFLFCPGISSVTAEARCFYETHQVSDRLAHRLLKGVPIKTTKSKIKACLSWRRGWSLALMTLHYVSYQIG